MTKKKLFNFISQDISCSIVQVKKSQLAAFTAPIKTYFKTFECGSCSRMSQLPRCRMTLTSEVVPGVGRQAGVLVLSAVVPGGRALPGTLRLHLDHQGNPLLLVT